ncbi:P2X purinoceptor 7-like [Argopecten irradians]|uniref:P2X purinoceptor 7-like n=1 Tax=Argopecten irradians TaxID=31199 RepID=UPI003717EBAA
MAESDTSDTIDYEAEEFSESPTVRGRGRGSRARGRGGRGRARGRPRGRGGVSRGRSRGRGSQRGRGGSRLHADDRRRVEERREQRKAKAQELVRNMSAERLRDIVTQMVEREPGLVFDLCEVPGGSPPGDPPAGEPSQTPSWCKCNHCREMPTDIERKCCDCLPNNCIANRPEMDTLVLDPIVLALGNGYHRDMLGRHRQPVEEYHSHMRHSAYRNFTLWRHGRLGQGVRRVVPSCCVWQIRTHFPDPTHTYTGFQAHRLA